LAVDQVRSVGRLTARLALATTGILSVRGSLNEQGAPLVLQEA
jgi:hypothetical protein